MRKAGAATTLAVAVGAVAFGVVWTALFLLQRQSLSPLRRSKPRFPTRQANPDQVQCCIRLVPGRRCGGAFVGC
jgi:hypothetical protein